MVMGMDVTLSLNEIVRDALADPNCGWVWFQADDHLYDDDALLRLLDRRLDVVVPLISRKAPPYGYVIYKGDGGTELTDDGILMPSYENYDPEDIPAEGTFPVYAAGSGGMLVRRHVLEAIGAPWFESSSGAYVNDDLEFCRKIREAGFEIHCDVEVLLGHIGTYVVRHERRNGRWGIVLDFGTGNGQNLIWLGEDVRKIAERQKAGV
jgi:GT2 family glycosyltransferase